MNVIALSLSSCNGVRRTTLQGGGGVVGGGVVVSGGVLTDATGPVGDGEFGGLAVVSGGPVVIGCDVGGATKSGKYCKEVNNFTFLMQILRFISACLFLSPVHFTINLET